MKKFRFRLQALLKVREHVEKQKQKELAVATQAVLGQRSELDGILKRNLTTMDDKREKQGGTLSVAEMLIYSRYLLKLRKDDVTGRELLVALSSEQGKRRQKLLEASRDRKVYDKLREKDLKRFNENAVALARKETDEIGINTFLLNQRQKDRHPIRDK